MSRSVLRRYLWGLVTGCPPARKARPAIGLPTPTCRPRVEHLEDRVVPSGNPIVAENQLPGTPQSTWGVSGSGDATIQGFASDISIAVYRLLVRSCQNRVPGNISGDKRLAG